VNIKYRIFIALIFILSITLSAGCKEEPQKTPSAQHSLKYAPGEIIVKFKSNAFDEEGNLVSESIKALNVEHNLISMKPLFRGKGSGGLRYIYKLEFPVDEDMIGLVHEYTDDPSVLYAEPNYIIHTQEKDKDAV